MTDAKQPAPSRAVVLTAAAVFLVTAGLLAWLGAVLEPSDREAMEGTQQLLFSVVSIKWFSWIMAGVFGLVGVLLAERGLR